MNPDTRQHHAALRDSRTRAANLDYAELEAIEDRLSEARDILLSVQESCPRAAARMDNPSSADFLRLFGSLGLADLLGQMRAVRKDYLEDAFHALANDCDAAEARLVAGYEAEAAE